MVGVIVCSIILLTAGFYLYVMRDIPSVKVLKRLENKPVSSIYGANGELIYLIVPDNRIFVTYNKIPQYVKDAFWPQKMPISLSTDQLIFRASLGRSGRTSHREGLSRVGALLPSR